MQYTPCFVTSRLILAHRAETLGRKPWGPGGGGSARAGQLGHGQHANPPARGGKCLAAGRPWRARGGPSGTKRDVIKNR